MARKVLALSVIAVVAVTSGLVEWRYSDDMQNHIDRVNRDLEFAQTQAILSSGLFGSLAVMKSQMDVGGEIIETREHVHTIKDAVLAWKIKHAIDKDGMTVGGAVYTAIAEWRTNF